MGGLFEAPGVLVGSLRGSKSEDCPLDSASAWASGSWVRSGCKGGVYLGGGELEWLYVAAASAAVVVVVSFVLEVGEEGELPGASGTTGMQSWGWGDRCDSNICFCRIGVRRALTCGVIGVGCLIWGELAHAHEADVQRITGLCLHK